MGCSQIMLRFREGGVKEFVSKHKKIVSMENVTRIKGLKKSFLAWLSLQRTPYLTFIKGIISYDYNI